MPGAAAFAEARIAHGHVLRTEIKISVVDDVIQQGAVHIAAVGQIGEIKRARIMGATGAGGKGNHFFISDTNTSPEVSEYGAHGEDMSYGLELKCMAHVGFVGLPNAGKSTLLRAITRAKPKVASYPFTTLKPHLGVVHYDDYEQISVADLPGLIPGSHENKGLGIQFLKHAERCNTLLFIVDVSCDEPWNHYFTLINELSKFSDELVNRQKILIANKMDLPEAAHNLKLFREKVDVPIIPISAKMGSNVAELLVEIRRIYDENKEQENKEQQIQV